MTVEKQEKPIPSFVLLNKKNGQLVEGYRVSMFDKPDFEWSSDIAPSPVYRLSVGIHEHDGWIIQVPKEICPFPIWMNRQFVDQHFENLGEL